MLILGLGLGLRLCPWPWPWPWLYWPWQNVQDHLFRTTVLYTELGRKFTFSFCHCPVVVWLLIMMFLLTYLAFVGPVRMSMRMIRPLSVPVWWILHHQRSWEPPCLGTMYPSHQLNWANSSRNGVWSSTSTRSTHRHSTLKMPVCLSLLAGTNYNVCILYLNVSFVFQPARRQLNVFFSKRPFCPPSQGKNVKWTVRGSDVSEV